jgi:hypothetical protein
MCYNESEKVAIYAQAIKGLMTIEPSINQQVKYLDFIDYYIELSTEEQDLYQHCYLKENSEGELSMGHAQLLRDEGMQQGEAILLMRLINKKFGSLPMTLQKKVERADTNNLLKWADNILVANCIEDIFK